MTTQQTLSFDVVVIGAGHAGVEAAYAAARMGCRTALVTINADRIGYMPCNPAVGGIGKGHIVFELSALGGAMPHLCTRSYLQGHMLNTSKGPAVHGLRLQIDKIVYAKEARALMEQTDNLTIIEDMADDVLRDESGHICGVSLAGGQTLTTRAAVITTGTFLNGLIHMGSVQMPAGRRGDPAVTKLAASIYGLNLRMGRLKTGTPPRLKRSSVDFSVMEEQTSQNLDYLFGFYPHQLQHKISCYITRTNARTHQIILDNAEHSPIFKKVIKGIPPRYCPSIEDKISRFASKDSHHIFVEPESAHCDEVYPNGLSTSLPVEIQEQFIRSIKGFENAVIAQPGYAIEYDFVYPDQLHHTLEVRSVPGLFLAGQINGTTGYEEAAGQGIIAGINAACRIQERPPFILDRESSYIGIMIDDLVTLGVDEPYRMFTSRAERRLLLRQDNVFSRFADRAHAYNLINDQLYQDIKTEDAHVAAVTDILLHGKERVTLMQMVSAGDEAGVRARIVATSPVPLTSREILRCYAEILYAPYKEREHREVQKAHHFRNLIIPNDFSYQNMPGLSKELQQKLDRTRPATIAQAALIQGMTPAAISLLIFKIREQIEEKTPECAC